MKIIIGAGKTAYESWISTQENELNLLNRGDFERMFMIIKFWLTYLKKLALSLICLNTAMKTAHSIINTGMNWMEKSDVHYDLTHEIKVASLAWCRSLLMPRNR